ncbi:MAG TPA: permease [Myxococcales bacterium]|nr:permease [Deltaproteobacteria bacterium]MBU53545.1 permease [Deltaproteobacteria bacterium]HAA56048.1 permease [Myxococcales bacterium]|tara:strand:+ start:2752 stop:3450 length:699 start_codon:yes stop_codon:yes gene_type:complete
MEFSHADFDVAANASVKARTEFLRKTYAHLFGAILAFVGLEAILLSLPISARLARTMLTGYNWLFVLLAFVGVSYLAERWAMSSTTKPMQYAGLALYIVAEAIIFLPLMFIATRFGGPKVIPTAGFATLGIFGALTAIVFITKKDFSFLGSLLYLLAFLALGYIVAGIAFGFSMGVGFSILMVGLAGGFILYDTSNVLHHYPTDKYVAASLALFASVALLFWYLIQIFMGRD